jgi:hypothetical protein
MKQLFIGITALLLSNSCRSSSEETSYTLFVSFNKTLKHYNIDGSIKQNDILIGNVVAVNNTDSASLLKIVFNDKLPVGSDVEFNIVDLIDNGRITVLRSSSNEYYNNGDTLVGVINAHQLTVDTSSSKIDSALNKLDPKVREILSLDEVKRK